MELMSYIGLGELLVKLTGRKGDLDKGYFENFVEPLWLKICEVHEDYKESFREYSKKLTGKSITTSAIVESIMQDSVYSEDLRSELKSMVSSLPSAFPKTSQELLGSFLNSLSYYFEVRSSFRVTRQDKKEMKIRVPRFSNQARYQAAITISRKGRSADRRELADALRQTMIMLQSNFTWVTENYHLLRSHLLT